MCMYIIVTIVSQCRHGCDRLKQEVLQAISENFYSHSNFALREVGSTFVIISCILINLCAPVAYSDVANRVNEVGAVVGEWATKVGGDSPSFTPDTWRLVAIRVRRWWADQEQCGQRAALTCRFSRYPARALQSLLFACSHTHSHTNGCLLPCKVQAECMRATNTLFLLCIPWAFLFYFATVRF